MVISVALIWCLYDLCGRFGVACAPRLTHLPPRRSCLICHLKGGMTGLHMAALTGELASLEALLDDFGADIEAKAKAKGMVR